MRISFCILLAIPALLVSCVSKKDRDAALDVVKTTGAKSFRMKSNSSYSDTEGNHSTFILTLIDPVSDGTKHSAEKTCSAAALLLLHKMDPAQNYDRIEIDVENGNSQTSQTHEVADLKKEEQLLLPLANSFFQHLKDKNYNSLHTLFDRHFFNDTLFTDAKALFMRLDSAHVVMKQYTIKGFSLTNIDESSDEEALMAWIDIENEKGITHFRLLISEKSKKIAGFKIDNSRPIE